MLLSPSAFSRADTSCLGPITSCCRVFILHCCSLHGPKKLFPSTSLMLSAILPWAFQLCPLQPRSLAGPCLLETLPKSGHQPRKASHGFQLLNTWVKSFRKHIGRVYPFLLSNSCLFLVAMSSITELPWDISQENKVNLLKLFPKCELLA